MYEILSCNSGYIVLTYLLLFALLVHGNVLEENGYA